MTNVVTIVASPILIKPWKVAKLVEYIELHLKPYCTRSAVTRLGQIHGGDHVLSLFLRSTEPGDLPEKMTAFAAGLNPLLGRPVEITVHDFRCESVEHLFAGPDPAKLAEFEAICAVDRENGLMDEIRFPGIDDEPACNPHPSQMVN